MLIDQFTPEELEQIKRELKFYPNGNQKNYITHLNEEIRKIFPHNPKDNKTDEEKLWLARLRLDTKIYEIVDYTMRNITFKEKKRPGKYGYERDAFRNSLIPVEIADEYKEFVDELLSLIKKHKK